MVNEELLYILKKRPGYVSGEDISRDLGISRAAIWKHIQELRNLGYDITAVPHLGYRLLSSPDRLFPWEIKHSLKNKFIGKAIYYYESLPSTMDKAMELALNAAAEGTLVIAEGQTKGKGRLNRRWFSPKYKGIYLSLILRPKILPNLTPILTLLSAVSICEAISENTSLDVKIKWPNDILIHYKKLGGILTELNAEMDATSFVIIGIGLNIDNDKKTLIYGATSLKEQSKENINRIDILQDILRRIEDNYLFFQKKGSQAVIDKWRSYSITLGKRVKIICQKKHLEGEAIDIDIDGGLLVRRDSGLTEKIMAGDVVHCR
jgi:BirA family biotin operon repressor/biotin-[acetyl-CoA-carboxylase] ligase